MVNPTTADIRTRRASVPPIISVDEPTAPISAMVEPDDDDYEDESHEDEDDDSDQQERSDGTVSVTIEFVETMSSVCPSSR